jgi:lysophospholipase L1-like esterase
MCYRVSYCLAGFTGRIHEKDIGELFVRRNAMVLRKLFAHKYMAISFTVLLLLLLAAVPIVRASSDMNSKSRPNAKPYYVALGDSLAFGYQPNHNINQGYVDDFFHEAQPHGMTTLANFACPYETSTSMIHGGCPYSWYVKYGHSGSQLDGAVSYITAHSGQVGTVTLDIGATDVVPDFSANCTVNSAKFNAHLAALDTNLKQTIMPKLHAAMTVNGKMTGNLLVMNYYNPYQNICPKLQPFIQTLNQHLAKDIGNLGTMVDVFAAFGGTKTPNPAICANTWICSSSKDVHPTVQGYQVIANAFERAAGY